MLLLRNKPKSDFELLKSAHDQLGRELGLNDSRLPSSSFPDLHYWRHDPAARVGAALLESNSLSVNQLFERTRISLSGDLVKAILELDRRVPDQLLLQYIGRFDVADVGYQSGSFLRGRVSELKDRDIIFCGVSLDVPFNASNEELVLMILNSLHSEVLRRRELKLERDLSRVREQRLNLAQAFLPSREGDARLGEN